MRRVVRALLAAVLVAGTGSIVQAQQQRTIGGYAGIPGAIWADRNNDGYVDGYVYSGKYYPGVPGGYQDATATPSARTGSTAPTDDIQPPDSVAVYRDGALAMVGDESRYGFTQLVPNEPYTVVLLACSQGPDFAMSSARPITVNQPRSGYYLSTLSLQITKSEVWYRLRASSKQDVGDPFTIALIKGTSPSEGDLQALRPICPAPASTPEEIKRRWGPLAEMNHTTLVFTNGKEVLDFDWIVPGKSMIEYRRDYGEKYTNSASQLLSWDERRQKIHSQYMSAGETKDDYFTPHPNMAKVIPYEDDRRRAKLARAESGGGGGGGLGGFLGGALAGFAGAAQGGGDVTSAVAGAIAGGVGGASGLKADQIYQSTNQAAAEEADRENTLKSLATPSSPDAGKCPDIPVVPGQAGTAGAIACHFGGGTGTGTSRTGVTAVADARPPITITGCSGFNESNYQEMAMQGGGDAQLNTLCGAAWNYYAMYKRAVAQGYGDSDLQRTWDAYEKAAQVADQFYSENRAR